MKVLVYLSLFSMTIASACMHQNKSSDHQFPKPSKTNSNYVWKKILDNGPWKKSYNFQLFNHRDTLWVFHPDGNWYSADGLNWTKSQLPNALYNLAFLDYVQFNDAIYGLGHFEGNIEKYQLTTTIYRSQDLKNWQLLAKESNLPKRFFYHPFIFDNKIWFIGGEDQQGKYADLWNSKDGINWIKQKDNLPFGKQSGTYVVTFKNRLYHLLPNEVWVSSDALNWTKLIDEIVKGEELVGFTPLVYDNKIWLLGCNRNGSFSSQVLVSNDGKKWKGQDAPWSPRGGIAATVFKNQIYLTGGKYGGTPNAPDFRYSNDLWALGKQKP